MRTDFESLADDLRDLLKAGLSTRLAAIDSEKNDGITTKAIDNAAYIFQDLNAGPVNYNPFIFYQVYDLAGDGGMMSATATRVDILIAVVVEDQGEQTSISRNLFRYQRAIRELIEEGFDSLANGSKMSLQSLVPIDVKLVNSSAAFRSIGVLVSMDWG